MLVNKTSFFSSWNRLFVQKIALQTAKILLNFKNSFYLCIKIVKPEIRSTLNQGICALLLSSVLFIILNNYDYNVSLKVCIFLNCV